MTDGMAVFVTGVADQTGSCVAGSVFLLRNLNTPLLVGPAGD